MSKAIRYVTILLATALLLVTIAGCGSTRETTPSTTETTKTVATTQAAAETTKAGTETTQAGTQIDYGDLAMQLAKPEQGEEVAVMETSMGSIYIRLFPEGAPKAVENFITHAKNGYFDGLIFHRVMKDFMIQGGDPTGTGMGGESIWGTDFEDEFTLNLYNYRGALSMANSGVNTNGSQFFIVQAPAVDPSMLSQLPEAGFPQEAIDNYTELGGTPWLDHRHTVFGMVFQGMEVVDAIAAVETGEADKPVKDVTIKGITIEKWESK